MIHLSKIHLLTCTVRPAVQANDSQVLGSQGGGRGLEPWGRARREGQEPGRQWPRGWSSNAVPFLAGEYVIIIRDVTNPPFLGRVLPTAFKHLRVSLKGMGQQPHIPGEGPQASS